MVAIKQEEQQQQQKAPNGSQDVKMIAEDIPEEELQLEEALKHIKLLHIKCRGLRTTIPRMLDQVTTTSGTPEEVFANFKTAVMSAQTQIKDFGELYNGAESKKVMEQARKSREAEPKGIKPWRAKDDPDWFFVDK